MGFRERWDRRVANAAANSETPLSTTGGILPALTIRVFVQQQIPRSRRTVWGEIAAPDGHPAWGSDYQNTSFLDGPRGAVIGATSITEFPSSGRYGLGMVLLTRVTEVAQGSVISSLTVGPFLEYRERLHLTDTPFGTTMAEIKGWATADPYVHDAAHLHGALTSLATEYLYRPAAWRPDA